MPFFYSFVKFNLNFIFNYNSKECFILLLSFLMYVLAVGTLLINLKNLLISLFFIELAYFGIIIFFIMITIFFKIYFGFLISLIIILIAASESAVGLAIVIFVYSYEKNINFDKIIELK